MNIRPSTSFVLKIVMICIYFLIIPQIIFVVGVIRFDHNLTLNRFLWTINHIANEQTEIFQKTIENYHANLYLIHHLTIDKIQQGRISSHEMNQYALEMGFNDMYAYSYENQQWEAKISGKYGQIDSYIFENILDQLKNKSCTNRFFFNREQKNTSIYLIDIESLADKEGNTLVIAKLDPNEFLKKNFYFKNIDNTQASIIFNDEIVVSTSSALKSQKINYSDDQYINKDGIKLIECEDYINGYSYKEQNDIYYCSIKPIPTTKLLLMISADYGLQKKYLKNLKIYGAVFILLIFLVSMGVVWLFQKRVKRPIIKLIQSMKNLSEGDLNSRYQQTAFGFEINAIGYHFNLMVESLKKVFEDIKNIAVKKEVNDFQIKIAKEFQTKILPNQLDCQKISIQSDLNTSYNISGDFFDFFEYKNDTDNFINLIIADTVGRGIDVCKESLKLKILFRTCFEVVGDFDQAVKNINKLYYQDLNNQGFYASCFFLQINLKTFQIKYLSCGHMPAFLIRQSTITELQTSVAVIGLLPDISLNSKTIDLNQGDYIVIYSDGIINAKNISDKSFGKNGLLDVINSANYHNSLELKDEIISKLNKFKNNKETIDDEALIIISRP